MNEQSSLPLPGPRVSRVTIGRLYSLGNYEHVRYEVSVELPPGASPASVIGDLDTLMAGMSPKAPHSDYAVGRAILELSKPEPTLEMFGPIDDADPFGDSPEKQLQRALRERQEARQTITEQEQWRKTRETALRRFDELGGTARHGGGYRDDQEA
jgi:hypothetical protein